MKRSILGISKVVPIALFISLSVVLLILTSTILPVFATWYTINDNPYFSDSGGWDPDTWMQGSGSHSYNLGSGSAYTYLTISGFNKWGNTEYEQGTDPWDTYGYLPYNIPADMPQRLITYSSASGSAHWLYGRTHSYVEFWLTDGTEWAEAMVILDSEGLFYPSNAGENQYWHNTNPGWYFVGYRHWNTGSSMTYRETNLNSIFNLLETHYSLDLSEWEVTCICFGVEATSGSESATWDYAQWDIGM